MFALRSTIRRGAAVCSVRYSSGLVSVDKRNAVAVVSMNKAPVNSMNVELMEELRAAIAQCEGDKSVKAMVLTSSVPRVFSAGLDITEMYQPKDGRLETFWTNVQDVWLALYGTKLPTIAAINGASPAGGCLLALSCDYRIMAEGKYAIGLNETLLGIVAPPFFSDTLINTVGHRKTEHLLSLGLMVPSADAQRIGMVDEVVPEDQVLERAVQEATKWASINSHARAATKLQLRGPTLARLQKSKAEDLQRFTTFARSPGVQAALGAYLEALKNKSKK